MISLLDVNAYASIALECLNSGDKVKAEEIVTALDNKRADRKEVLAKLEAKASELGSDNAWNRYEALDEAYGYAEELSSLIGEMVWGDEDYDNLEWQISDLATKTKREAFYRLERAQW
jgi:hypothetical protein